MFSLSRRQAVGALAATAVIGRLNFALAAGSSADAAFQNLVKRWLDEGLRLNPIFATYIGDHRFDTEVDDVSAAGRAAKVAFLKSALTQLMAIDRSKLSRANQADAAIFENEVRFEIWDAEVNESWEWDPLQYNELIGSAVYLLIAREFAPLPERLNHATARMEKMPKLLEQTRASLDPARVPKIHAETVAKQNKGIGSIGDGLVAMAGALPAADKARLTAAAATMKAAIDEHQKWIEGTLVPNAKGDFRIGPKRYDEKLKFALMSSLSRQEIRAKAEAALTATRAEMYTIARGVLAGKAGAPPTPDNPTEAQQNAVIGAAMEIAYADRPARDKFVAACEAAVTQTTAFVREKDFITLPDAPVKVIVTPEFKRGVAGAYCDPPGPLDKGMDTLFAVDPVPDDWTQAQVDSYLREYNNRSIQELTIHEAMPGHYTQLWHSNKYPSVLRAVLFSGPFVEGWACYSENVMAEQGYLNRDPLYLLMHLKLNVRVYTNAIMDSAIHVDGMSEAEAMKLMMEKGFQQEREAAGKWVRARVSSCQLPTYFVGMTEHIELRAETEKRWGANFNLKKYHDTVLSFGSPPVKIARALMFDEPIG